MDKDQIRLRPATADDATFVNDLLHRTMHQYVEATWPNEPAAQQKYYEINRFDPSNTRILQRGGEDIGRLSITIRADCIFVDELHILPQYQRRGIGQWVIQNVLEEARQKKLPVKLMVLQANPAQQL